MSQHEKAFECAVNIIRSMPKDGPFQPSPDMMLRFYGLYKQATLGKCTEPKPSFWAVIAKAKWDAWKSHGNMPKEEAMKKYVEGLKEVGESPAITRIVETMSYSDDVAKFMHVLGPFYEAVYDGQEPENLRLRRSPSPQPSEVSAASTEKEDESGYSSSINGSNTESTDLELENNNNITNSNNKKKKEPVLAEEEETLGEDEEEGALVSPAASYASLYASDKFYSDAEESDEDEYKDPIDLPSDFHLNPKSTASYNKNKTTMSTGEQLHVTMAIQRLQADLQSINNRLDALEKTQQANATSSTSNTVNNKRSTVEATGSFAATYSAIPSVNQLSLPSWFPFKNVNLATIIVILGWPFVAQYVMSARLRTHRGPSAL